MATPKRLDFSSPGGDNDGSPSIPCRRSLRLLSVKRPASEPDTETKKTKKKKKLASPVNNMIWNEEDELAVLKGLVGYREKTSDQIQFDWDGLYGFVRGSIASKVSKNELFSQIKKLKRKFLADLEEINQGNNLIFTKSRDSEAFGFSMMIWGQNEDNEGIDKPQQIENDDETFKEVEEVARAELLKDCNGKSPHEPAVEEIMDNGAAGKEREIHDDATAADEILSLRDAFESMMCQCLFEHHKKLQFEKVMMNLGTRERQELSEEWKALLDEGAKYDVKKLRFFTKFAEATAID